MSELTRSLKPGETVILLALATCIGAVWWFASGSNNKQQPEAAQVQLEAKPNPDQILPETIVQFSQGTYACLDPEDIQKMIGHTMRGEKTKASALEVSKGGGCLFIPPGKRVRVISAQYQDKQAEVGLLEVIGEKNESGQGAWALSIGAEPVK